MAYKEIKPCLAPRRLHRDQVVLFQSVIHQSKQLWVWQVQHSTRPGFSLVACLLIQRFLVNAGVLKLNIKKKKRKAGGMNKWIRYNDLLLSCFKWEFFRIQMCLIVKMVLIYILLTQVTKQRMIQEKDYDGWLKDSDDTSIKAIKQRLYYFNVRTYLKLRIIIIR